MKKDSIKSGKLQLGVISGYFIFNFNKIFFNLTFFFYKKRRIKNYEFTKCVGREKNNMYARSNAAPDYHPKFEYCKKVIAVSIP